MPGNQQTEEFPAGVGKHCNDSAPVNACSPDTSATMETPPLCDIPGAQLFQTAFQASPVAMLISRFDDGLMVELNEAFARLCGYERRELIGRTTVETGLVDPEQRRNFSKTLERQGSLREKEILLRAKDGKGRWVMASADRVTIGGEDCILWTGFDISRHKAAEEELRETEKRVSQSEALLKELVDRCPFGIYIVDSQLRIDRMNARSQETAFRNAHPVIGRSLQEVMRILWPEAVAAQIVELFRCTLETGESYYSESFMNPRGDLGVQEAYEWELHRLTLPDGQAGVICYYFDSTELRLAQEALQQSEDKFKTVVENSPDIISRVDREHRHIFVNSAITRITGMSPEHFIGRTNVELGMPAELCREWDKKLDQVFRTGQPAKQEFSFPGKDGTRHFSALLVPETGPDGTVDSLLGIARDITEQKESEQALLVHRELLETVINHLPMQVCLIRGSDLRLQLINPAYQALAPGKQMLGKTLDEIWPETGQNFAALCRQVLESGEPYHAFNELNYIRRHPETELEAHYFTWSLHRVRLPGNEGWAILNPGWDTTEQRRADEAIRRKAEELSAVLHTAPAAIWIADDPQCRKITGNAYADDLIMQTSRGGNISRSAPPGEAAVTYRVFRDGVELGPDQLPAQQAAATAAKVPAFEMDLVFPNGRKLSLLAGATPLFDENCRVRGAIVAGLDVTPLKQAQEALRESEHRFREMADGTPVPLWVADAQGKNRYVNRAYCRFFGVEPRDAEGLNWQMLVHPDAQPEYEKQIQAALAEHKPFCAQVRVRRHDGVWRWMEVDGEPRFGAGGEFLGLAGSCYDVTERKAFQEELERLIAERTARLQELVTELEHFSYTITHDLKAPLRAMKGYGEVVSQMCQEWGKDEAAQFLRRIMNSADRMDALIRDALSYSQAVRQELPLEDIDPGALIKGMLDSYPELQRCKAHIRIEGPLPVVLANEAGLTQCFSNLLGNAVKFTRAGQAPEIRVRGEQVSGGASGWARIWVEDNGIGIPKEMLPRIFQMFARASRSYEGTGIGLALVRKVVQRMGGRVGVESEEGRGSRFWLELKTGHIKPLLRRDTPVASSASGAVLYVEDEENDALFMERAFDKNGLAPALHVVTDGHAAIEYLSGTGKYCEREQYPLPDVVLLDLNLPGVPGFEVLQWMRNHPDFTRTPVIVFSSSTREDDRQKARELGANDFVTKPKSGLDFTGVVQQLKAKFMRPAVGL